MKEIKTEIIKYNLDYLKVGVISDSQITPLNFIKETVFEKNLTKSLQTLKDNGCNMIIFAGDITNKASKSGYKRYFNCYKKVFGDNMPIIQHIMGNHDYYFGLLGNEYFRNLFKKSLKQDPFTHYVVNEYHFIGASPTNYSMVSAYGEIENWIEHNIQLAIKDDPSRPIFITTHNSPKNTTYGSFDWGDVSLNKVFDKYPQIVNFAGHSHYSILDERCFYNDKYIAMCTQATAYCEMERGKENGTIPPFAYTCPMGYIIEFNDKIIVHRFDLINNKELKSNDAWQIYPRIKNKKEITKPEFINKECKVEIVDGFTHLTFNRAQNNDIIHSYKLVIDNKIEQLYFSDFYLGEPRDKEYIKLPVYNVSKGKHDIKIYAINSNDEISDNYIEIKDVYINKLKKYKKVQTPDKINYRF